MYTYTIQYTCILYTCIHVYIYHTYTTYTIYNVRVYIYYTNIYNISEMISSLTFTGNYPIFFNSLPPPGGGGKLKYISLYSGYLLVCFKRCD